MTSGNGIAKFDDLETREQARVFWGFFWRGILTMVAASLGGAIVGFILGFILGFAGHALGWSVEAVRTAGSVSGGIAGFVVGLALYWQYIRWLFSAKWFGYQLRLVRHDDTI